MLPGRLLCLPEPVSGARRPDTRLVDGTRASQCGQPCRRKDGRVALESYLTQPLLGCRLRLAGQLLLPVGHPHRAVGLGRQWMFGAAAHRAGFASGQLGGKFNRCLL